MQTPAALIPENFDETKAFNPIYLLLDETNPGSEHYSALKLRDVLPPAAGAFANEAVDHVEPIPAKRRLIGKRTLGAIASSNCAASHCCEEEAVWCFIGVSCYSYPLVAMASGSDHCNMEKCCIK